MNQNINPELFITRELKKLIETKFFKGIKFKTIPLYDEVLYYLRKSHKIHIVINITESIWYTEVVKINGSIDIREFQNPDYYTCLEDTLREIIKSI